MGIEQDPKRVVSQGRVVGQHKKAFPKPRALVPSKDGPKSNRRSTSNFKIGIAQHLLKVQKVGGRDVKRRSLDSDALKKRELRDQKLEYERLRIKEREEEEVKQLKKEDCKNSQDIRRPERKRTTARNNAALRKGEEERKVKGEIKKRERKRWEEEACNISESPEERKMVEDSNAVLRGSTAESTPTDAEQERRERIQRYKDERRKQIAARYGNRNWSSEEENEDEDEASYRAYRRKRKSKDGQDSSSTETSNQNNTPKRTQENGSVVGGRSLKTTPGSSSEGVASVRGNRAMRLRQAARLSCTTPPSLRDFDNAPTASLNNNNDQSFLGSSLRNGGSAGPLSSDRQLQDRRRKTSTDQVDPPPLRVCADSTESTLSGSDGRSGRLRTSAPEEKDKSHKRKSNLNRASSSHEPTSSDLLEISDSCRRRRRRHQPLSSSTSTLETLSGTLKSPEILKNVVAHSSTIASVYTESLTHEKPNDTITVETPPLEYWKASIEEVKSAPSTLDTRTWAAEKKLENESFIPRSASSKSFTPIRKPDIPDVLKPKDSSCQVIPGYLSTPPSSRPASIVIDKPPLIPEGLRPTYFRSSLRKPADNGTCFLASKREKKDDFAPDILKGFQHRLKKPEIARENVTDIDIMFDEQSDVHSFSDSSVRCAEVNHGVHSTDNNASYFFSYDLDNVNLDTLLEKARESLKEADSLSLLHDKQETSRFALVSDASAEKVVNECEGYLIDNKATKNTLDITRLNETMPSPKAEPINVDAAFAKIEHILSNTSQKNGTGGSEGFDEKSKWLVAEENKTMMNNVISSGKDILAASAIPSEPPMSSFEPSKTNFMVDDLFSKSSGISWEIKSDCSYKESCFSYEKIPRRYSTDGAMHSHSPDPHSILKRRPSGDDSLCELPPPTEPHGILKKKSSYCTFINDFIESDPKPILKKKNNCEEAEQFEPKPILKKKASTDDELEDKPKSILKSARSKEDIDYTESAVSPYPILKRYSRGELEDGELKPILKRRETVESIRLKGSSSDADNMELDGPGHRLRSDSVPNTSSIVQSHSPPPLGTTPVHGILKKRGSRSPGRFDQMDSELGAILRSRRSLTNSDTANDDVVGLHNSAAFYVSTKSSKNCDTERPLSVAERIAGMEALQDSSFRTVPLILDIKPKECQNEFTSSSNNERQRRHSSVGIVQDNPYNHALEAVNSILVSPPAMRKFCPVETVSPNCTASIVSKKTAYFAMLEKDKLEDSVQKPQKPKRERGARFSTQPVTDTERSQAARLSDIDSTLKSLSNSVPQDKILNSSSTPCMDHMMGCKTGTSLVGAKIALWSRLTQTEKNLPPLSLRNRRSSRSKTQPVTLEEVAKAFNVATAVNKVSHREFLLLESSVTPAREDKGQSTSDSTSYSVKYPRRKLSARLNYEEEANFENFRGILKQNSKENLQESSPKSILKSDSRRSPFSENEAPKSILKSDRPSSPAVLLEQEGRPLKGVLKKDLSREDQEIKSILKPESLEIDHSSDSSSADDGLFAPSVPLSPEHTLAEAVKDIDPHPNRSEESRSRCTPSILDLPYRPPPSNFEILDAQKKAEPIKSKDNLAEALRQIQPIWSKERGQSSSSPPETLNGLPSSSCERTSLESTTPPESVEDLMQSVSRVRQSTSVSERYAALQKSGEEGWKRRVDKDIKDFNSNITLREKNNGLKPRPVSLLERVSQLENSSQQWKERVMPSDAKNFTVAHKLASASTSAVPSVLNSSHEQETPWSPSTERKKPTVPQLQIFKSKTGGNLPELLSSSTSPLALRKEYKRTAISSNDASVLNGENLRASTVPVPQADDYTFDNFFRRSLSETSPESETLSLNFDNFPCNSSQLLITKRNIKINRRQHTSHNPLKALAARTDIKNEYTEIKLGVGERELRRIKVEELSRSSTLAVEALAGLASKENFSAVALKKVEDSPVIREMAPFKELMLIQVKGRRQAQTRLVQPALASVNKGDDFILVIPDEVFHYKGQFANVIERAKATEIAQFIIQQKDMGVHHPRNVTVVEENSHKIRKTRFWNALGGNEHSEGQPAGPVEEDEEIENVLTATNKIYIVIKNVLVPLENSWGQMPKVLVLDFGAELYIWTGKNASANDKQVGLILCKEMWEEPYDYSSCDLNPISPLDPNLKKCLKGNRPEWGLCAKLTENVETVLFKEKFIDWPDEAQMIRIQEVKKELDKQTTPVCELEPCNGSELLNSTPEEPDLVLEMCHLGRGTEYYDEEEKRLHCISTHDIKMWHIQEYGKEILDSSSHGHFYAGDAYVVRWYYHVTATGRTLSGMPSKHAVTGRFRVAYFFWQGSMSSISDKGAAALMTIELDEERGPHVRVAMGFEPPAFLAIFTGAMVIYNGQKGDRPSSIWRLFIAHGEQENEAHLMEVDVKADHLRSRSCLVLINTDAAIIYLWNGAKALKHTRLVASHAVKKLAKSKCTEMGWSGKCTPLIKEEFEGAETRNFWEGIGGKKFFFSLLNNSCSYTFTPRLWWLEATPLSFEAHEVLCTYRLSSVPNPMPFTQQSLYMKLQPALFLLDAGTDLWVWQGWWPEDKEVEDSPSAITGSAILRFNFARKAAFQTALNYSMEKVAKLRKDKTVQINRKICEATVEKIEPKLVLAGMEPPEFTSLFPIWGERPDVRNLQEKEGHWENNRFYSVMDILKKISRTQYSLSELQKRPLPDGVDPHRLESYLPDDDFSQILGISKKEFNSLQSWKQIELKKKASLF